MVELYDMMFKRKSFRQFKSNEKLTNAELEKIANFIDETAEKMTSHSSMASHTPMTYKIVPISETTCKRGEYAILIYSNFDNLSLLNIGYIFGQLDFFLASIEVGSCWYGMGKLSQTHISIDLPYTIMIAIGKANKDEFRKDYTKAKRKTNDELCAGDVNASLIDYVKYSPSACNSQPWLLSNNHERLSILFNPKEKMLIPKDKIVFYNAIDLGIMIYSCEIWLRKHSIQYKREIKTTDECFKAGDTIAHFNYL